MAATLTGATEHREECGLLDRMGCCTIQNLESEDGLRELHCAPNEKCIFLYSAGSGLAPYTHAFVEAELDPQILSGFVAAMTSFMREMTGIQQSHWQMNYGTSSTMMVEGGEWIFGTLVVYRSTEELRSKLRRIVREFEDTFSNLREEDGFEVGAFREFDQYVRRVFLGDRLSGESVVVEKGVCQGRRLGYDSPRKGFRAVELIARTDLGQTVAETAAARHMDLDEALEAISRAVWNGILTLAYVPVREDIMSLSEGSSSLLFSRINPLQIDQPTLSALTSMDGRRKLSGILKETDPPDRRQVLLRIGRLVSEGYVQRISLERSLVFSLECTISRFLKLCSRRVGLRASVACLRRAKSVACLENPWAGRIDVSRTLTVKCRLDASMTPTDLDEIYGSLSVLLDEVKREYAAHLGNEAVQRLLSAAAERCNRAWSRQLRDVML